MLLIGVCTLVGQIIRAKEVKTVRETHNCMLLGNFKKPFDRNVYVHLVPNWGNDPAIWSTIELSVHRVKMRPEVNEPMRFRKRLDYDGRVPLGVATGQTRACNGYCQSRCILKPLNRGGLQDSHRY